MQPHLPAGPSDTGVQIEHPPARPPPRLAAPPIAGSPAAHHRPASTAQHQPAGKHCNRPRVHHHEEPPSAASSIGFANLIDLTVQTDILHLARSSRISLSTALSSSSMMTTPVTSRQQSRKPSHLNYHLCTTKTSLMLSAHQSSQQVGHQQQARPGYEVDLRK